MTKPDHIPTAAEIHRVHRWECESGNGHDIQTVQEFGEGIIRIFCGHCGATWRIVEDERESD